MRLLAGHASLSDRMAHSRHRESAVELLNVHNVGPAHSKNEAVEMLLSHTLYRGSEVPCLYRPIDS